MKIKGLKKAIGDYKRQVSIERIGHELISPKASKPKIL